MINFLFRINLLFIFICAFFLKSGNLPVSNILNSRWGCFIENKGQWPDEVICRADFPGGQAWITKNGVVYDFYRIFPDTIFPSVNKPNIKKTGHLVYFEYLNSSKNINKIDKKKKKSGNLNYFIGNDHLKWTTDVGRYGEIIIHNIYEGISVRYYFQNNNLRYDFIVENGNPSEIKIKVDGAPISKTNEGLTIKTNEDNIIHKDLKTFQYIKNKKAYIPSKWVVNNNIISFEIGNYNLKEKLIIDPVIYSTYLGTSNFNANHYESSVKLKADNQGNAYITGVTNENSFPSTLTLGPYSTNQSDFEIFVSKLNPNGTQLVFSVLIGGTSDDYPTNLLLRPDGIYVCGVSKSTDFPISNNAFQNINKGLDEGILLKLNPNGNALVSSTYFGGNNNDYINDIKYNPQNNLIYICGKTESANFPITTSAFQTTLKNQTDGFISATDINFSNLIHSSYIGGNLEQDGDEEIKSLFIANNGNVYFTGITSASDFPVTNNLINTAFTNTFSGIIDIIFGKFDFQLKNLTISGFLGGDEMDKNPVLLHSASLNEFMLIFYTESSNLPSNCSGYSQPKISNTDIYILKFDDANFIKKNCTYFGGISDDYALDADIDDNGHLYITGYTNSYDYPQINNIFNFNAFGWQSIIISEFNQTLTPVYSEALFTGNDDYAYSIFVGKYTKEIYVTGSALSFSFPITPGSYQDSKPGDSDPFVLKFYISNNPRLNVPFSNTLCLNTNFSVSVFPNNFTNYTWIAPNGSTLQNSTSNSIVIPLTSTLQNGHYSVYVQGVTASYTLPFKVTVLPYPDFSNAIQANPNFTVCAGKTVNIIPNDISPYILSSSNINLNTIYTVTAPIPFTVFATYSNVLGYGCSYPKSYTVYPTATLNTSVSQTGYTLTSLENSSFVSYQWKDCNTNAIIPGATQQSFSPIQAGSFYVKLISPFCIDSSSCFNVNPNLPYVSITSTNVSCIDKQNGIIKIEYVAPYPYQLTKTDWKPDICDDDICLQLTNLAPGTYTIDFEFKNIMSPSNDYKPTFTITILNSSQPCIIKPYNSVVIGSIDNYFHIDGISEFTENEVYIFSRWGNKIADIKNYNNIDKRWPEKNTYVMPGTYYYVIYFNKNSNPIKGWLEVIE